MFARLPPYEGIRLSIKVTRAPRPTSLRASIDPMKPQPPLMSTFFP